MAMHVSSNPRITCNCMFSRSNDECRNATRMMLTADTKHFAKLSRYFSMNDTSKPHIDSDATVAYAHKLKP